MTAYMTAWAETRESPLPVAPSASGLRFSRLFPLHVDETQSRRRGLDVGWYVIDNDAPSPLGPTRTATSASNGSGKSPTDRAIRSCGGGPIPSGRRAQAEAGVFRRRSTAHKRCSTRASHFRFTATWCWWNWRSGCYGLSLRERIGFTTP